MKWDVEDKEVSLLTCRIGVQGLKYLGKETASALAAGQGQPVPGSSMSASIPQKK